ncbi:MAG TPA: 6-phosphogluconolactonase [Candidatus Binatia bacterium]|jgi:6-phosphogluconolactonase/glucosamine-6-phosphate isomerase/deaminase
MQLAAPDNIHRVPGEKVPQDAAADYENELRTFCRSAVNAVSRFDLVLLGLGEGGHTASPFPGSLRWRFVIRQINWRIETIEYRII